MGSLKYINIVLCTTYVITIYILSNSGYITAAAKCEDDPTSYLSFSAIGDTFTIIFALVIPIIFLIYILCKIPAFDDDIGIRKELRFSIWIMFCIVFWIMCIVLTMYIANIDEVISDYRFRITFYVYMTISRCLFFIQTLSNTRYIIIKYQDIILNRHSSELC